MFMNTDSEYDIGGNHTIEFIINGKATYNPLTGMTGLKVFPPPTTACMIIHHRLTNGPASRLCSRFANMPNVSTTTRPLKTRVLMEVSILLFKN